MDTEPLNIYLQSSPAQTNGTSSIYCMNVSCDHVRLCDLHVSSQWPSETWQGSSKAGLHKERPSILSKMQPGWKK